MEDLDYSEDSKTWDVMFEFDTFNDTKIFMSELDSRYDADTLTGLNFFFVKPNFFMIGCVFSKKIDIYELVKLAQLFKGRRKTIPKEYGDWLLYFTTHSHFNALGDGYKLIQNIDEDKFNRIVAEQNGFFE
jgi:hypothetical protein